MKNRLLFIGILFAFAFAFTAQAQITLVSPTNNSLNLPRPVNLSWNQCAVPVTNYWLICAESNDFLSGIVYSGFIGNATFHILNNLQPNKTYYWRVWGFNGNYIHPSLIFSFHCGAGVPSIPVLWSPPNGSYGVGVNPTLDWLPSFGGPLTYTLQVSKDPGFAIPSLEVYQTGLTTTSHVVGPTNTLTYNSVYYWRVSAQNTHGTSFWSNVYTFNTCLYSPILVYPPNNSTGQALTSTLNWNTIPGVCKYEYEISDSPFFMSLVYTGCTFNTFKDIPSGVLQNDTKYFWRIRGYQSWWGFEYPGTWSEVWNFRTSATGNGGIIAPLLSFPINGQVVFTASPMMIWYMAQPAAGLTYELQFNTENSFENFFCPPITHTGLIGDSFNLSGLMGSTNYYWRVRAYNASLNMYSAYSIVGEFVTDESLGPVTPVPSYPTGGITVYSTSPSLIWYVGASVPNLTYDIEYNKTGIFTGIPTISSITVTNKTITGLLAGNTYYWKVRSVKGALKSAWSTAATFFVDPNSEGAPIIPIASYPTNGVVVYTDTPTLIWYLGAPGNGLTYDVEIKPLFIPFNGVPTSTGISTMFFTTNNLLGGGFYHWRVRSFNGTNHSNWSLPADFKVDPGLGGAPIVPIPSYPTGGTIVYSVNPALIWYLGVASTGLTYQYRYAETLAGLNFATIHSTPNTMATIGTLLAGKTYYWQVRSFNGFYPSFWSIPSSFVTTEGSGFPLVPVLAYPSGGITIYNTSLSLSWYVTSYTGIVGFRGQISTNPSMFLPINFTTTDNFYSFTGLIPGTTYYWRIQSFDGVVYSPPSPIGSFTIEPGSSAVVPTPGSPTYGVQLTTVTPELNWYIPTGTSDLTYDVEVSTDENFTSPTVYNDLTTNKLNPDNLTAGQTYYWRVRSKTAVGVTSEYSFTGEFTPDNSTGVGDNSAVPVEFSLSQNYPNPFNPTTTIKFSIPEQSVVSLKIFNILGEEIRTLINDVKSAGSYSIQWNGNNDNGLKAASGVYIYKITAGNYIKSMKMTLLK